MSLNGMLGDCADANEGWLKGFAHPHGSGGGGQRTWKIKRGVKSISLRNDSLSVLIQTHFLAQKAVQSLPMLSLQAVLYSTWKIPDEEVNPVTPAMKNVTLEGRETHQEDQTMQKQSVEEGNGSGHLVGEDHASLKDRQTEDFRAGLGLNTGTSEGAPGSPG